MAAEHNNFINKQLQDIIASKDETISKLQAQLDKQNDMYQSNYEDKMSLTQQLTQSLCCEKQLSDDLDIEKKKVKQLNYQIEYIEKTTETKVINHLSTLPCECLFTRVYA